MGFPTLETERLQFVEIEEKHIDSLFEIFSREEVTRYHGMSTFKEREQAVELASRFSKKFCEKSGIRWAIILKETNTLIGTVGLNNLQLANKRAEIGYELHPSYWRKGIASEAIQAVLQYSFETLDLHRIGAVVFPQNVPSQSLLMKFGFQREGILRGYIYQEEDFNHESIASATSIRKALFQKDDTSGDDISNFVPSSTLRIINNFINKGGHLVSWDDLFHYLQGKIITSSNDELSEILLVNEGIENRIKKIVPYSYNFEECMKELKTKRYTWTRIQRTLLQMVTNTDKDLTLMGDSLSPPYVRVLGFNSIGQQYLQSIKKNISIPLVTLPKHIDHPFMDHEIRVAELYAQLQPSFTMKKALIKREMAGPVRI